MRRLNKISQFKQFLAAGFIFALAFMVYQTSGLAWSVGTTGVMIFAGTFVFGAPYVPTLKQDRKLALKLLGLKKGQTLYEMGAGDGSLCLQAAQLGLQVVGYEINPILAAIAKFRTYKYRENCKIIWGDMWEADLSKADGVFVFLAGHIADKFEAKFNGEARKGARLVSLGFEFHLEHIKSEHGLNLYTKD